MSESSFLIKEIHQMDYDCSQWSADLLLINHTKTSYRMTLSEYSPNKAVAYVVEGILSGLGANFVLEHKDKPLNKWAAGDVVSANIM